MPVKKQVIIDAQEVGLTFGDQVILENITFTVQEGEYLGVIGPNGGGKTMLLSILLGLIKPTSGSVKIFGHDAATFEDRHVIGYVPQRIAHGDIDFPATVREIVASGRTPRVGLLKVFRQHDYEAVTRAMDIAGIGKNADRRIGELSGGERQRVFIARALAAEPKLLILDEPTVGVDVASQERFYDFLEELNKKRGITILFVTHDMDVVASEATTVLCLNHGLICHGTPKEFMKPEILERLYGKKRHMVMHGPHADDPFDGAQGRTEPKSKRDDV
jgi:zinc transport system ATP-binding protein